MDRTGGSAVEGVAVLLGEDAQIVAGLEDYLAGVLVDLYESCLSGSTGKANLIVACALSLSGLL